MDRRVLVVDDDQLIREMTRDALAAEGVRVAMSSCGPEALELFYDRYPFDVRPVSDDAPFFWHFTRWRSFFGGATNVDQQLRDGRNRGIGD